MNDSPPPSAGGAPEPRAGRERARKLAVAAVVGDGGIPIVFGPAGSGKRSVAAAIEGSLSAALAPRRFSAARIDAVGVGRKRGAMLAAVTGSLGVAPARERRRTLQRIEQQALLLGRDGVVPVVLVLNAEVLPAPALDEIKLIWDLVTPSGSAFLVRIVLFAAPGLVVRLRQTRFRALRSRVSPWRALAAG